MVRLLGVVPLSFECHIVARIEEQRTMNHRAIVGGIVVDIKHATFGGIQIQGSSNFLSPHIAGIWEIAGSGGVECSKLLVSRQQDAIIDKNQEPVIRLPLDKAYIIG